MLSSVAPFARPELSALTLKPSLATLATLFSWATLTASLSLVPAATLTIWRLPPVCPVPTDTAPKFVLFVAVIAAASAVEAVVDAKPIAPPSTLAIEPAPMATPPSSVASAPLPMAIALKPCAPSLFSLVPPVELTLKYLTLLSLINLLTSPMFAALVVVLPPLATPVIVLLPLFKPFLVKATVLLEPPVILTPFLFTVVGPVLTLPSVPRSISLASFTASELSVVLATTPILFSVKLAAVAPPLTFKVWLKVRLTVTVVLSPLKLSGVLLKVLATENSWLPLIASVEFSLILPAATCLIWRSRPAEPTDTWSPAMISVEPAKFP